MARLGTGGAGLETQRRDSQGAAAGVAERASEGVERATEARQAGRTQDGPSEREGPGQLIKRTRTVAHEAYRDRKGGKSTASPSSGAQQGARTHTTGYSTSAAHAASQGRRTEGRRASSSSSARHGT